LSQGENGDLFLGSQLYTCLICSDDLLDFSITSIRRVGTY
jgi:hypothetical protein